MAITVNTKVLSNSITDLGKVSDYYYRKISDFAKTSSATPLANVLADVRANYESIAKNVINFSNYLVSYYNDIQALEFKMSNSGSAYISESTVASIVSQYNNSITKTSISYDKIFDNIQVADFSETEVTAQNSMDLSSFSFDMETIQAMLLLAETDKPLNEEQIDFLTAYYHNYYELERQKQTTEVSLAQKEFDQIDKVEKNLRGYGYDFASLESAIQMAKANGDEQELKKLQKLLKDTGYKGKEEYDCALKEAKEKLQIQSATLHSVEQYLKTLPYTFQIRDEKYQNYQSSSSVKKENLQDCIVQTDALTTIDYKAYCKKYGDVDPYSFMKTVKENYKYAEVTGMENKDLISRLVDAGTVSPELANFYVYSYETNGSHASKEYLEAMEEQINMHCGELEAKKFLDSLADLNDEETRLKALSNHLQVSGKGLFDGAEGFASNIGYAVEGLFTDKENRVYSASEYETMFILQGIATQKDKLAAGLISEDSNGVVVSSSSFIDYTADYGKLLDHNYQISQSIGNMLPSIAISAVNPIAGKLSFGLSAGGGSYHSAMVEGFSKDKALAYGAFSGASEVVTEKFLGAIPLLSDVNVTNFKTFFQSAFKEGVEEFVQSYMDAGASSAILNKTTDFDELRGEAVTSALYGMITGGIMNTPSLAINRIGSHFSSSSMSEADIKALSNEYKQVVKEQMTDLAKENRKNVSHGKTGSLLAGAGLFGIGADIFGGKGNHSSNGSSMATNNQGNDTSSLQAKKDQILRDNPKLAAIEEQYKNGERITVPKDLSDSFTELRKISAELNTMNLGQKVTSSYISKVSTPSKFDQTLTNIAQSVSNLLKRSISKATLVTDGVAKSSIDSMMNKEHLDVAKQNRKNVSHRKSDSSFSKTNMDGNISSGSSIHQVNDVSSLQARKDQILRDNPRLAAIEEQYKNGERITVPKDLSDSFTELRKISAELAQYTIDLSNVQKLDSDFAKVQTVSDVAEVALQSCLNQETIKNIPKALFSFVTAIPNAIMRFKYDPVVRSDSISNKILNEGLYHFTSLEAAEKIISSSFVRASDPFTSYGPKKSFFFAGIPSLEHVAVNLSSLDPKRVAIKFQVDESDLSKFNYRSLGDQAITYNGDFHFDTSKAQLVYLGMFQENGKLVYKELSKADYDNYHADIKMDSISKLKNSFSTLAYGFAAEYTNHKRIAQQVTETFSNANISNTLANVSNSIVSKVKNVWNGSSSNSDVNTLYINALNQYESILNANPNLYDYLQKYYKNQFFDFNGNTKLQNQFNQLVDLNNQLYSLGFIIKEKGSNNSRAITIDMLQNVISNNVSNSESAAFLLNMFQKILKKNPESIALNFSDPKQYIISKLPEITLRHGTSNSYYNDCITFFNKTNKDSVNEISFHEVYNIFGKYLSPYEKVTLNDILHDKSSAYNNFSDVQRNAISFYTKIAGPIVTAALRKSTTFYSTGKSGGNYYGNDPVWVQNSLKDAAKVWTNVQNDSHKMSAQSFVPLFSNIDTLTKVMDSLFQSSPTLQEDVTVFRVVDGLYKDGNKISTYDIGTIFNDSSYLSTTLVDGSFGAKDFTKIKLKIEVPKGTQCVYMEQFTGVKNYGQQELLLNRGTSLQVTGDMYFDENNQLVLPVKVVNPELSRMGLDHLESNSHLKYFNEYYKSSELPSQVDLADMISYMKRKGLNLEYEKQVNFLKNNQVYDFDYAEHGFEHVRNVLLYAMYMGDQLQFTSREKKLLAAATALHDSGLKFSTHESNHGLEGAKVVPYYLDSSYSTQDINLISAAIAYHEMNDSSQNIQTVLNQYGISDQDVNSFLRIANVLKDADALDRVRFPGNLNVSYLRTNLAKSLVQASFQNQNIRAEKFLESKIIQKQYDLKTIDYIYKMRQNNISDYLIYMDLENNWYKGTRKKIAEILQERSDLDG